MLLYEAKNIIVLYRFIPYQELGILVLNMGVKIKLYIDCNEEIFLNDFLRMEL